MRVKNVLMIIAGFIFLGMGAIGLLIPVWPTTPFVILSAACLTCSPKLRGKLMRIQFFREHIENYKSRQGLSAKTVCISLGYLWIMLLLSIFLVSKLWITLLLCVIGTAVTVHIVFMAKGKSGIAVVEK